MARSVSEAMRLAKKLQKQGQFSPAKANKKQRSLVHQWAQAIKAGLGVK